MKKRVFISNYIEKEKIPNFREEQPFAYGAAHYSWKIVANLYKYGFESANIDVLPIARPEIYQDIIAHDCINLRADDTHIAIKPVEHIRPFYGMRNIFISGWEFAEFSENEYNNNPFYNQINLLKGADEIWCWSNFTKRNLHTHGLKQAITMPPPVLRVEEDKTESINLIPTLSLNTTRLPTPEDVITLGEIFTQHDKESRFLTILNPFDKRKQIVLLLKSFSEALQHNPNIILIVKLIIDNKGTTLGNIQEILSTHYQYNDISDKILFIGENLTNNQMRELMRNCTFYFCTSSAEGLNLPLIEAMSLGLIPISTDATAMGDYINKYNAIILPYEKTTTIGQYHAFSNNIQSTHYPPILESISQSLLYATSLTDTIKKELSFNAKKTVEDKYSVNAFIEKLTGLRGF